MNTSILFPTDFRPHSDVAFEQAKTIAASRGSRLIVLHVCNMPDMPYSTCPGMTHHEEIKSKLELHNSARVHIEHIFTVADPGPEICRLAAELGCELIVMGVTYNGVADYFVCGSVRAFVEKNARCTLATLILQPRDTTADAASFP